MTIPDADSPTTSNAEGRIFLPVGLAVLFLGVTLAEAHVKLLWQDELVTVWVGQQRSFGGIWRAATVGASWNPPLSDLLSWWSTRLLGMGPIAVRLPSMVGMGLGLGCLWGLLRRQFAPVYAAAGCLIVMATPVLDFGYDATPYGLLFGVGTAATLMGFRARRSEGLRLVGWLTGMVVALAIGVSMNPLSLVAWILVPVICGAVWVLTGALVRFAGRRGAVFVVAILCVTVLVRQAICGYVLVHQRNAFMRLEHAVERTAAPGETVLVGDPWVAMPLYWYGSAAMREQIVFVSNGDGMFSDGRREVFPFRAVRLSELGREHEERLLIARPGGSLVREVEASGFVVSEVETAVRWERMGGVSTPVARAETRVLLAAPKDSR